MLLLFTRGEGGGCVARAHRRDGVVVELASYTRRHRLPHDLAHFVTERELHLSDGVFGSIAAGALFASVRVVSGRQRHDAVARSKRILAANRRALSVAEVLSGVLHDTVEHRYDGTPMARAIQDWGIVEERPFPWAEADIARATGTLREVDRRWSALPAGGVLEEFWPDVLTSPVPVP
jgi:hypothetical protein